MTNNYNIQYWEVGNEVYGNGSYGSSWEADTHALGATSYANNYLQFYQAMKAADPNIKVGVVLTTPGNWPDGIVASSYGDTQDWNHTVLSIIKDDYDLAIVHFYPGSGASEATMRLYRRGCRH